MTIRLGSGSETSLSDLFYFPIFGIYHCCNLVNIQYLTNMLNKIKIEQFKTVSPM